jgi:hypothetical protein
MLATGRIRSALKLRTSFATEAHDVMQAAHIAELQAKVSDMAARLGVTGQMADAAVARASELAEARTQMAAKTREVGLAQLAFCPIGLQSGSRQPAGQQCRENRLQQCNSTNPHDCMKGPIYNAHTRCNQTC